MLMRTFVAVCLVLTSIACDARSPLAPLQQSTPPTLLPGLVVDSSGAPVAGASITFWPHLDEQSSSEAGQFPLPVKQYYEFIYASKVGYESFYDWAPASRLTLHNIVRITPGQSARVTIRPDDSLGSDLRYRDRTIRVHSGGDRIVRLQVVADDSGPVDYHVPELCNRFGGCPQNPAAFFLEGGGERQVRIQIPAQSTVGRTFTLNTWAEEP